MFNIEFIDLFKEVLTSWQVIAVTIAVFIYLRIVSHVAKYYKTPKIRNIAKKLTVKSKKSEESAISSGPETTEDSNDDLGLEEA